MIRHVALMRWKDGTTEAQVQAVSDGLAEMPETIPEIVAYSFGADLGITPAAFDYAVVADFASVEDYHTYSADERHHAVVDANIGPIVAEIARIQFSVE